MEKVIEVEFGETPTRVFSAEYLAAIIICDDDRWSMAFYTYSRETYEPCLFDTGSWQGTPEEAFDTSSVYLIE
jgi:hypothetical protein